MKLTSKTIEYNFENTNWRDGFTQKKVIIIFEQIEKMDWYFGKCKYSGLSEIYTEEDWDFLKEVADEIKELKKELNK